MKEKERGREREEERAGTDLGFEIYREQESDSLERLKMDASLPDDENLRGLA